nr:mitochondrial ribosomal protein L28 [Hymenolepis microstoma]CUU97508.1 mitochondrial ribosomal protein L28 [Hymenolepis microstoma]
MSRFLFYPHARDVVQRLPEFYKKNYLKRIAPITTVSYFEDDGEPYIRASNNALYPKEHFNVPPKVIFPEESQRALWGGEGIVTGFIEVKRTGTRVPKTWGPELRQHLFHSEVLERWMMIIVSLTALKQIEEMKGLDFYLLKVRLHSLVTQKTPENEINSRLGLHIKREILMKLGDPEFQLSKPDIATKYADFVIPREEAEWVGLTLDEAIKKQMKIEYEEQRLEASIPKKIILAKALIESLESDGEISTPKTSSIRSLLSRFIYNEKK